MSQTLFIRDLSQEELAIISLLKKETASATMSKAVRKGLVCYKRILDDYRECARENVELRQRIRQLEDALKAINSLSSGIPPAKSKFKSKKQPL